MVTNLSDGYIYILDANVTGVFDDVDADDIDLDGSTEGQHYCKIKIPEGYSHKVRGKPSINPLFGGTGYAVKNGQRFEVISFSGIIESRTEVDYVLRYFTLHLESGSANDYIVIRFGSTDHYLFRDASSTQYEVAPGVFTDFEVEWGNDENQIYNFSGKFTILW